MKMSPDKNTPYQEPSARVLSSDTEGNVVRTVIEVIKGKLLPPIAPAGLYASNYASDTKAKPVFELHKILSEPASNLTFESYEVTPPS
jgi:hypothetical protein